MSFTAEELLQKMFPVQSKEMISLMNFEKLLLYKLELITKEESSLVDVMLAKFDKRLPLLMERYRSFQAEKIQIRKDLLQTRIQLSSLTKKCC